MSKLVLPNGIPNFTKAVISFWFRIPIDSLRAAALDNTGERLSGVVPLLVFGPEFDGYNVNFSSVLDATYNEITATFAECAYTTVSTVEKLTSTGPIFTPSAPYATNPSFVGVGAFLEDDDNIFAYLQVRIQMQEHGSGTWVNRRSIVDFTDKYFVSAATWDETDECPSPYITAWHIPTQECLTNRGGTGTETTTFVDETAMFDPQYGPDVFEIGSSALMTITPDTWHHVLISFDLEHNTVGKGVLVVVTTPDCVGGDHSHDSVDVIREEIRAVEDPCRMWIALDDTNRTGEDIFNTSGGYLQGFGSNDIAPSRVRDAIIAINSVNLHTTNWASPFPGHVRIINYDIGAIVDGVPTGLGLPTYTYTPHAIPSSGYAFGIPATPQVANKIRQSEFAEFQMWTGVTLDTGIEANRRLFIDDGGNPVDPSVAEEQLGTPLILLHGTANWKVGDNTGSGEDLDPTRVINRYEPDPSLYGEQGPQGPDQPPGGDAAGEPDIEDPTSVGLTVS